MRRLLVFTSARSDYGILRPLLRRLQAASELELGLFVTGTHLEEAHGATVTEIEADAMPIVARERIVSSDDSWVGSARLTSRSIEASAAVLDRWQPDLALVLGDRVEALGFAIACHYAQLPLAHLHGGEVTSGAIDDSCRHAITKFASLHLAAAAEFGDRIVQLGERPESVHVIGALGLDSILEDQRLIGESPRDTGRVLVTYHPATSGDEGSLETATAMLHACIEADPLEVLVTLPNADHGSDLVRTAIDRVAAQFPG
ncbi:MAG: UDP-N-acetylglucosamine 2-epimerase, partial [Acidimicrobiales bacterium]